MKVEQWAVDRVKPYPKNPRKNDAAVPKVVASIREYGFRQPIVVDEKGVVIVGHTRLKAAHSLGLTEVPVHVATGLTAAQVKAYRIADNRTNKEAEWEHDSLIDELRALEEEGLDLALTGFDEDELAGLLVPPGIEAADLDNAEVPEPPADPITKPGDVIQLGQHRLVCGDSTDTGAWAKLLGEEKADCVWTDPPYGVSYVGKTAAKMTIENDALGHDELTSLLRASLSLALAHSRPGAAWWVAGPHGPQFLAFAQVATDLAIWRQTVVWAKDRFVLGRQDMQWAHEVLLSGQTPGDAEDESASDAIPVTEGSPIIYGWTPGDSHEWHAGRTVSTVWTIPRPKANREHPTMKPVALIERSILATVRGGGAGV